MRLSLFLVGALTWPLAWLPPVWGLALGAAAGRLIFRLSARRRAVAVGNLEMIKANGALPPELDAVVTARAAFANLGRSAWEAICFYHRGFKPFKAFCHLEEGKEHLDQALAEARANGCGVVMAGAHLDNWELIAHYLHESLGLPVTVVGRDSRRPVVDALIHRLRTMKGNSFAAKGGGVRDMLTALKNGQVLATLIDQAVLGDHHGAVMLPFLGREATTNLGPVRLARHARAPVIQVLTRRQGRCHYISIFPVSQPEAGLPAQESLTAMARQINDQLGDYIRRYPDQWMWGHRRWKTAAGIRRDPRSIT